VIEACFTLPPLEGGRVERLHQLQHCWNQNSGYSVQVLHVWFARCDRNQIKTVHGRNDHFAFAAFKDDAFDAVDGVCLFKNTIEGIYDFDDCVLRSV
jgi:hypothetical protein